MDTVSTTRPSPMARIDLRGAELTAARLRAALPRGGADVEAVLPKVRPIVQAVAERGAEAALEFGESFDGVRPPAVRVPAEALEKALAELDAAVAEALRVMIERTRAVHADQRRTDVTTTLGPGATVTERWVPVERVGLYVPGGNAVYPSSVVMNVVPAQAAGVASLVVASPPQAQFGGLPHPTILAAARLLRVDEVWAVGGAQAVALLAYGGTDTGAEWPGFSSDRARSASSPGADAELAPVDMITGPGNIYVTAAKRLCRSRVGIDAEAGPTEIAILADNTADPAHVAADMISQAEHDEMAGSVLVTPSEDLAAATDKELAAQLRTTVHRERVAAALGGRQSAIILVDDVDAAQEGLHGQAAGMPRAAGGRQDVIGSGAVVPEAHRRIRADENGSRRAYSPGHARRVGGLDLQVFGGVGVDDLDAGIHVVDYTEAALKDVSGHVITLAEAEDLPAHGEAVRRRFER